MRLLLSLCIWLLLCAPAAAQATETGAQRRADKPNIIFFLVDDLGWRDLGCFGSSFYETPHIDRLASQGVRFNQAYAACHVCSPTRASIMTGKYPARIPLTDWLTGRRDFQFQELNNASFEEHLPFAETTLAEALRAQGYSTGHFGKWHLGEEPSGPTAHGFDVQIPRWNKGWPRSGYHAPFGLQGLSAKKGDYLTDRLTDEALAFVEENKDQPFFLYLAHFAVHDPIQGRPDLVEKYRAKLKTIQQPDTPAFILEGNPDQAEPRSTAQLVELMKQASHQGYSVLPQRTVKIKQHQDNIQFAGMVEALDESLGRVQAKLEELGLAQNTIVIFFSDNGGMSGANLGNPKRVIPEKQLDRAFSTSNLPLRGAKGWLYEGGIRVPMIVKWPGHSKPGTACEVPVISTDFFPSILAMAGLPALPEQHLDGLSFAPAVEGQAFAGKPLYWHFPHYSNHGMQSPGGAVRVGDYKLLEYFENGTVQLFDLSQDPGERVDLANVQPAKAKQLKALLANWRRDVGARMMTRK